MISSNGVTVGLEGGLHTHRLHSCGCEVEKGVCACRARPLAPGRGRSPGRSPPGAEPPAECPAARPEPQSGRGCSPQPASAGSLQSCAARMEGSLGLGGCLVLPGRRLGFHRVEGALGTCEGPVTGMVSAEDGKSLRGPACTGAAAQEVHFHLINNKQTLSALIPVSLPVAHVNLTKKVIERNMENATSLSEWKPPAWWHFSAHGELTNRI